MKCLIIFFLLVVTSNAQDTIWSCGFETNFCNMVSETFVGNEVTRDDWRRSNGNTPSTSTGPSAAREGAWYAFFEASFRSETGDIDGILTSPSITYANKRNFRISLYYYDYGSALNQLRVKILGSGGQTLQDLLIADGRTPTQVWNFTTVAFNAPGNNFRIQFNASTTGRHTADWAIDDVKVLADAAGCSADPCVSTATCQESANSFTCQCRAGFTGDGLKTGTGCQDVNECSQVATPCTGSNVRCVNTAGSFSCQCLAGYQAVSGSGTSALSCSDINECSAATNPCIGSNVQCMNTVGSFTCQCLAGYQPFSGAGTTRLTCIDINECSAATNPCTGSFVQCINTAGSFRCQCMTGYQPVSGTGTTALTCTDINECSAATNPCTGSNVQCMNTAGSFTCQCLAGYQPVSGVGTTGLTCIDINECAGSYCTGANVDCINSEGSATCQCRTGFIRSSGQGTTLTCIAGAVNECLNNPCPANSRCVDQTVGFTCTCISGFNTRSGTSGANLICDDINECSAATNPCTGSFVQCINTAGSFNCQCTTGYQPVSGTGTPALTCTDINECNTIRCDSDAQCFNNGGSYECRCNSGFTQVGVRQAAVCHRNGGLTAWVDGPCSQTCGGGQKTQTRSCTNPTPEAGGAGCDPTQPLSRTMPCNTQDCNACDITKPCTCNSVIQYRTGHEPNMTLLHFNDVTPSDVQTVMAFLNIWNRTHLTTACKNAKCNRSMLMMLTSNITYYINRINITDNGYKAAQKHMREVIDCNANVEIEGNLWRMYDVLCDRSITINQVKKDLMQKKVLLEQEMKRCSERGWFGSFIEMFHKRW
ncbi:latent-transforming growth factor beta-binding protein 4-like [Hydractinia symbiolongicarpus]|uniref:latent-transforming growth factor beta-binding protein 4-like n=1 Tax=Hydractinia symbiolongicarpus TaxID=13093 RepID=UPI002551AEAD|nr:latent-transforming growth factor beta-binding protein 4-like [Hydractinia symbiolongicarpus]XP_057296687.1 latent-transforming growth factor beta-binding protein 4-like [Hydractinia symbiolongicarpus]